MRKKINVFVLLLVFVSLVACVKEESQFTVPYAKVNFNVDVNGVDSDLRPFTHKVFLKGRVANEFVGFGGLLVFMSSQGDVYAFDLCCPYEDDKSVLVEPTGAGKAYCKKCQSLFVLIEGLGYCESGPSKESLQKYNVIPNSQRGGVYYITN